MCCCAPRSTPAPRRAGRLGGTFWGAVSGFTSFVSHAGAPPYQVYVLPLGLEKTVFAGTTTILFAYVNAIKLVPYWALGQLSLENLKVAAVLTVPAVLAVFAGDAAGASPAGRAVLPAGGLGAAAGVAAADLGCATDLGRESCCGIVGDGNRREDRP